MGDAVTTVTTLESSSAAAQPQSASRAGAVGASAGRLIGPPTAGTLAALAVTSAVVAYTLGAAWRGGVKLHMAFSEASLATLYNAVLLLLTGVVALATCLMLYRARAPRKLRLLWLTFGLGFVYLAADERFMFHERFDHLVHNVLGITPNALTDHLDDLIVGVYGLVFLLLIVGFRRSLTRYRAALPLVCAAGAMGVASFVLDIASNSEGLLSIVASDPAFVEALHGPLSVAEEAAKLFAVTFVLLATARCFRIERL